MTQKRISPNLAPNGCASHVRPYKEWFAIAEHLSSQNKGNRLTGIIFRWGQTLNMKNMAMLVLQGDEIKLTLEAGKELGLDDETTF